MFVIIEIQSLCLPAVSHLKKKSIMTKKELLFSYLLSLFILNLWDAVIPLRCMLVCHYIYCGIGAAGETYWWNRVYNMQLECINIAQLWLCQQLKDATSENFWVITARESRTFIDVAALCVHLDFILFYYEKTKIRCGPCFQSAYVQSTYYIDLQWV